MTDDFMTHHRRRVFERDIACVRANRSEAGARLYSDEEHQAALRRLEHAIEQAGGEAAYVEGKVRAAASELESLRLQAEATDATLGGFGLPPTRGNILAEDDALRMIGMSDQADIPVSETNLEGRVIEWAHGPHQRGHASQHKPGRDAVVGEVIEKKARRHCRGPRLEAKADLIQILWTLFITRYPGYDPKRWSVATFAAVVANSGIKESVRKDARRRAQTPEPKFLAAELAAQRPAAPDHGVEIDVQELLQSLSASDRSIVMARIEHDSDTAAAKSLGMKRQTFVDRLHAIKSKLHSQLLP